MSEVFGLHSFSALRTVTQCWNQCLHQHVHGGAPVSSPSAGVSCPPVYFSLPKMSTRSVLLCSGKQRMRTYKNAEISVSLGRSHFSQAYGKCWNESLWLSPGENEAWHDLEILWGENAILVSVITDVITWFLPREVSQLRRTCISSIVFQI